MELSKEQIQYIEHRLENEGVKYWDIRIEMLDHVISDLEKNLNVNSSEADFKKMVQNSFVLLGWHGSFNDVNKHGWKNVNKYYRKIYFKGFVDFFKNIKNLIVLALFLLGYYIISEVFEPKVFLKISHTLFFLPFILFVFVLYKMYTKKYGKSVHKDYGLNYLMLSFLILNAIVTFVRVEDGFPQEFHKIILFIIIPVHFIFTYSGYQVYVKAIKRVENMRKQLLQ
ncbi:hypothetical protein BXQ17_11095 [Polaribacter sp. BM10]|uniref:hypothetical protein n=1 Tax=Polaribacter sp. BM10 TaxID=1529069 RepID=UPI00098AEA0F|nr:hypothetical protein [Polaribacter sp. BM10]AQS94580.1 hypothetical protein BXQ17_11095 [Polaribacter sp. BM10]